jgi:hypothetical protein
MIPFDRLVTITRTLNPVSVANATCAEQDFTVTGVLLGDVVLAFSKPTTTAGLGIAGVRVKAADTISVNFVNPTASPIDPGAELYTLTVLRPERTHTVAFPMNAM